MGEMTKNANGENKITFDDLQKIESLIPKPSGFNEIKIMSNCMIQKGLPVLLCHPDDYESIKNSCVAKEP